MNRIFLLFIPILLVSCAKDSTVIDEHPYSSAFDYQLDDREFETARSHALSGNGLAARKVSDHYFAQNKIENGIFWLRLSAENGYCDSIKRISQLYEMRTDNVDHELIDRWNSNPKCKQ